MNEDFYAGDLGISLRDWFAGQVLAGISANPDPDILAISKKGIASYCYDVAECMLAERRRVKEPKAEPMPFKEFDPLKEPSRESEAEAGTTAPQE